MKRYGYAAASRPAKKRRKKFARTKKLPVRLRSRLGESWRVVPTAADGDCGFDAVAKALTASGAPTTISDAREALAASATADTWRERRDEYKRTLQRGDEVMRRYAAVRTLRGLRRIMTDQDHYATLSDINDVGRALGFIPIILNKQHDQAGEYMARPLVFCPGTAGDEGDVSQELIRSLDANAKYVLLLYQPEHYELVVDSNNPVGVYAANEVPAEVMEAWRFACT